MQCDQQHGTHRKVKEQTNQAPHWPNSPSGGSTSSSHPISSQTCSWSTIETVRRDGRDWKSRTNLTTLNLTTNIKKRQEEQEKIKFFGLFLSVNGVELDSKKTEAVKDTKTPDSKSSLCSFLGLTNYCSRSLCPRRRGRQPPRTTRRRDSCRTSWNHSRTRSCHTGATRRRDSDWTSRSCSRGGRRNGSRWTTCPRRRSGRNTCRDPGDCRTAEIQKKQETNAILRWPPSPVENIGFMFKCSCVCLNLQLLSQLTLVRPFKFPASPREGARSEPRGASMKKSREQSVL